MEQLRYYYDERQDILVYENGARIPRPPNVPKEYFMAVPNLSVYQAYEHGHYSAEAPLSPNTPRAMPQYHNAGFTKAETVARAYVTAGGSATGAVMSPIRPMSSGSGIYTTNSYGTQRMASGRTPPASPDSVTTDFQRIMNISSPLPAPYHPTAFKIRRTSEGASVMHIHDTQQAMAPSNVEDANVENNLYSTFKRPQKSRKFFVTGKVFLTLWAEPAGDVSDSSCTAITDGISAGSFGEPVFSKIRRFVVVREGEQACAALPIVTYGHQGVSKPGVTKSEHAIVHTGKIPPNPLAKEFPERGERPLLPQPIRVDPDNPDEKLDPMSRIDFAKVYTIQHNVKVRSLGKVNRASIPPLMYQFKTVWMKYFGDSEALSPSRKAPSNSPMRIEGSASCSQSELIAAYNTLRAAGWTEEQARAPLLKAGLRLSSAELEKHVVAADDNYEQNDTDTMGEHSAPVFENELDIL